MDPGCRRGSALYYGSGVRVDLLTKEYPPEVYGGAECFGRQASAYAKRQLDGRSVSYTVGKGERDRYGRVLVYLWLPDGRSFNALLVSRGFAQPLTVPPDDDYADTLLRLARRARTRAVGLWAADACAPR